MRDTRSLAAAVLPSQREALPGLELLSDAPLSQAEVAEQTWRWLMPFLVPETRPVVRLSARHADGRIGYPASAGTQPWRQFPTTPAAMYVYGTDARSKVLVLDFDAKGKHRAGQVDEDVAAMRRLLIGCGAKLIEDRGPGGGVHLYVVWETSRSFEDLARLTRALLRRAHGKGWHGTLDRSSPMLNRGDGLIRTPGAPHRLGGFQVLVTPIGDAVRIARRGNGPEVWSALHELLELELAAVDGASLDVRDIPIDAPGRVLPGGRLPLSPTMLKIATTGEYPAKYHSGSEARQAVLTNAYARGWSLADLMREAAAGALNGLNALYARYADPQQAWIRDWRKAGEHVDAGRKSGTWWTQERRDNTGGDTKPLTPEDSPACYQDNFEGFRFIRTFINAVHIAEEVSELSLLQRLVLRALASQGMRHRGQRHLAVGVRSLDLGSAVSRTKVSDVMRTLRAGEDPWLELIEEGRGPRADLYELRIPERYAEAARWRRWRSGRLEGIHFLFRTPELGPTGALVYEALGPEPLKPAELVGRSRLPERTQRDALARLADHGLAERAPGGAWRRGPVSLNEAAAAIGADEAEAERHDRIRAERAEWALVWPKFYPELTLAALMARPPAPESPAAAAEAGPDVEPDVPVEPQWHRESAPAWLNPVWIDGVGWPQPPEPPDVDDPDYFGVDLDDGCQEHGGPTPPVPADDPVTVDVEARVELGVDELHDACGAVAEPSAAAPGHSAAATGRWEKLTPDDQGVLAALFHADQAADAEEKARRTGGHPPRPAALWRPQELDDALSVAAGLDHVGTDDIPYTLEPLIDAGLLQLHASLTLDVAWTLTLTRTGRAAARAGLNIALAPRRPKSMMSIGYWRVLDRVARSGTDGVPHDRIWAAGTEYLGDGAYPRRGRGFITRSKDRWFLTPEGQSHWEALAGQYRDLYEG